MGHIKPTLAYERRLWRRGYTVVAGVDEVGRGAWAGPLVAAAVLLPPKKELLRQSWCKLVNDSKKLSPKIRRLIYSQANKQIKWAVGMVGSEVIDKIGVAEANRQAVNLAVKNLKPTPDYVLVDFIFRLGKTIADKPAQTIVDGDARVFLIALASIMAKVARDRLMTTYDKRYPGYGFAQHKGYGTRQHAIALKRLGPCVLHRLTYRPVKAAPAILKAYERRGDR